MNTNPFSFVFLGESMSFLEGVSHCYPFLLYERLEANLCPAVGIKAHLDQRGHNAGEVTTCLL